MKVVHLLILLLSVGLYSSCKKEHIHPVNHSNTTVQQLKLLKSVDNGDLLLEIYTEDGKLTQGYNKVYLKLKDKAGNVLNNLNILWEPMMNMLDNNHSCPRSEIVSSAAYKGYYEGYLIFQMAGDWDLTFQVKENDNLVTLTTKLTVLSKKKRNVVSFLGSDSIKYILAMVEPREPIVGTNVMKAMLYKMDDMVSFSKVNHHVIKIDPRMPSMGNHGTPNNINLTQSQTEGDYLGKVNFTMSGWWKINLQVLNANAEVIKGEKVSSDNENSSIYFEVEF